MSMHLSVIIYFNLTSISQEVLKLNGPNADGNLLRENINAVSNIRRLFCRPVKSCSLLTVAKTECMNVRQCHSSGGCSSSSGGDPGTIRLISD